MAQIADGRYVARAHTWMVHKSQKGSEQLGIEFELMTDDGPRNMTAYLYFTEKAVDRTIESLRICGWKGDDLSDLTGLDANEVEVVVESEEYEGKVRPKIRWINATGGLQLAQALTPEEVKSFAQRMKGAVLSYNQKKGLPKQAQPAASNGARVPEKPPF